jgi:hypothetical protein
MTNSTGGVGAGGYTIAPVIPSDSLNLSEMDLEAALTYVQIKRAENQEDMLRDQLETVQKRNQMIESMNNILAAVRAIRPGSSKGEAYLHNAQTAVTLPKDAVDPDWARTRLQDDINWVMSPASEGFKGNNTVLTASQQGLADLADPKATTVTMSLQAALAALGIEGFSGKEINQAQFDQLISTLTGRIDSLNSTQQLDMLRLQSLSNKRNEAFEIVSNFIKKMADNKSSIIGNMR